VLRGKRRSSGQQHRRCSRPRARQGPFHHRRHSHLSRRDRAPHNAHPDDHVLHRQGAGDRARLVEVRSSSLSAHATATAAPMTSGSRSRISRGRLPFSQRAPKSLRRPVASDPSISGKYWSVTTTSGREATAIRMAVTPSLAPSTRMPCAAKYIEYISRVSAWSSTIRTIRGRLLLPGGERSYPSTPGRPPTKSQLEV